MKLSNSFLSAMALAVALPTLAQAQHAHSDMKIGSSADGSGDLIVAYPFTEAGTVRVTDSGFPGLFTATDPGFVPALDEAPDLFELGLNTEVDIEITALDSGVSLQVGATPLSAVGDSATIGVHDVLGDPEKLSLHDHPTFQLLLSAPGDTFAEGRVSFRLNEGSGSSHGYGESEIYTMKLSNGYLPGLEGIVGAADLNCRKAVALRVRLLTAEIYKRLGICLDRIAAAEHLGRSAVAARKACEVNANFNPTGLAGKVSAATQKALAKIAGKCGALSASSEPFTASAIKTHLGMASCRAQELAGATYEHARDEIAEVLGECNGTCLGGPNAGVACVTADDCAAEEALEEAFPCLVTAVGGE